MTRLDTHLVDAGLVTSRNRAAREIKAGRVSVNGTVRTKPAFEVGANDEVVLVDADPWVARSAHKLLTALHEFGLEKAVRDTVCLDAGASTGGFTQVLLAHGAARVHAVDVGHDQLDPRIAGDPRVHELSGFNLKDLGPEDLAPDDSVDLLVADVSFISLTKLLDPLFSVLASGGRALLMVKPQFELSRGQLDHGVVRDPRLRARAVSRVAEAVSVTGGKVTGCTPSGLPGPSGNAEYFLHVIAGEDPARAVSRVVGAQVDTAPGLRGTVTAEDIAEVTRREEP